MNPVLFDATWDVPAVVTRTGKVFECGAYPDKDFALTEAEADAAIAAFQPVPLEVEHFTTLGLSTIFDGKLGRLTRLWREGNDLHGSADVAPWVDGPWTAHGRKVSLVWDRTKKQVVRCGLVLKPRVSDAALMAAFATFAGQRHSASDLADLQTIHDLACQQGAQCAPAPATPPKEARMSFADTVRAWFDAGTPAEFDPQAVPAPVPAPSADFSAEKAALAAEKAAIAADKAAFAAEQYKSRAQTEVARLITEGRVLPAENQPNADGVPALVALFTQLYADDATAAVTFTAGATPRVAALLATYSQRPAHPLTTEAVSTLYVVPSTPEPAPKSDKMDPARKAQLVSMAGGLTEKE